MRADRTRIVASENAATELWRSDRRPGLHGGQFVGNGNGGNLSTPTLIKKGALQRSLIDLSKLED